MSLKSLWMHLTETKALRESSGVFETSFFEPAYRISYFMGLSSRDGGIYLLYRYFVLVVIALFLVCEFWYLFTVSTVDGIIDNVSVTIIHVISIYRYKNLMNNEVSFKNLASTMESPYFNIQTNERKKLLNTWISRNKRYFNLLLGLACCTLIMWYVYPLVDDVEYNLTVAMRLPFEYGTAARYAAVYPAVLFAFHYISFFVIVNDVILQTHLLHLICQFNILADCFENILTECKADFIDQNINNLLKNEVFVEKYINRLSDLVTQHKFLLSNTIHLRNILRSPMLYQFAASSLLICFCGYQVTANVTVNISKFVMSLLYLSYNMFVLYVFCRWCEEIKIQCENIRDAVYSSGWECGVGAGRGVRARLLLVLVRAGKPVVLSAGGIYDLSLSSYTTLVKTSYSALTVLLRFKHN